MPNLTENGPAPAVRDTSWAARYGGVILRDGIAAIPRALFLYQGALDLTAPEVWFASAVLSHKWDADLPHPSLGTMVAQTGVSKRQLQVLRGALCAKGHLVVSPRHDDRGGTAANSYDFGGLFSRLEAAILADPPVPNAIEADSAPDAPDEGGDASFIARFGRLIARAGVIAVPAGIYTHQAALGLSPQECWFVTYILSFRWTADLPYPSLRKMAARTGYTEQRLHKIKNELVGHGYLQVVPRRMPNGGQDTNGYDFSGLLNALSAQLRPAPPPAPPASEEAPRHSRRGRAARPEHDGVQSSLVDQMQSSLVGGVQISLVAGVQTLPEALPGAEKLSGEGAEGISGGSAESLGGRGAEKLRQRRSDQKETIKEDDSNRPGSQNKETKATTSRYSAYIAGVVLDYSQEVGDKLNGPSNVTQALRLWEESGLGEDALVELLHESRKRLRLYQGKQGGGYIANKMAYFFRVLEQLIKPPAADGQE